MMKRLFSLSNIHRLELRFIRENLDVGNVLCAVILYLTIQLIFHTALCVMHLMTQYGIITSPH